MPTPQVDPDTGALIPVDLAKVQDDNSGVIAVALMYENNSALLKSLVDAVEEGTLN